jgi:hypothetical protein
VWDEGRLRVGTVQLWRGTGGVVLFKDADPSSATDGSPLGWKRVAYLNNTTPNVAGGQQITLFNISEKVITDFTNGFEGQVLNVVILAEPGGPFTKIKKNSSIRLNITTIEKESSATKNIGFNLTRVGTKWIQTSEFIETDP